MATFLITFSVNLGPTLEKRYKAVVDEIQNSYRNYCQITKTTFVIVSRDTAKSIREKLTSKIRGSGKGEDGVILVVDVSLCGWASHDLPENVSDWLDQNI